MVVRPGPAPRLCHSRTSSSCWCLRESLSYHCCSAASPHRSCKADRCSLTSLREMSCSLHHMTNGNPFRWVASSPCRANGFRPPWNRHAPCHRIPGRWKPHSGRRRQRRSRQRSGIAQQHRAGNPLESSNNYDHRRRNGISRRPCDALLRRIARICRIQRDHQLFRQYVEHRPQSRSRSPSRQERLRILFSPQPPGARHATQTSRTNPRWR